MRLWSDLRYAVRRLRRAPAFTGAAVASLTLGIATATTVFSLLDAAALRPPPFEEPDRLVVLNITQQTPAQGEIRLRWSWPRFRLLVGGAQSFAGIASVSNAVLTLTGVDDPEPVRAEFVSSRYLAVMRAPLLFGAGFTDREDDSSEAAPVAILEHDFWIRRFGGNRSVLGTVVNFNGVPLTVAGVMSPGFTGVSGLAQVWVPAMMAPRLTYRDYLTTNQNFITAIGRLRPGIALDTATAEIQTLGVRIHAVQPSEADTPQDRFSATLMTLNDARRDVVTMRGLALLSAAAGVLLLIACANVASLQLGRAVGRRREMAVRLAIGASRRVLVREQLTEAAVLAALACALGLFVTLWATAVVRIPPTLARGRNFYGAIGEFARPALDWRVLAFALLVSAATVLLFGLLPALRATRRDLTTDLKSGGASVAGGRVGLRDAVVGVQIALAVFLVIGCGLLLTSYTRLRQTPLGFEPDHLLTFTIRPSEVKYPSSAAPALLDRILEEVARVPGVEAVTVDGCAPLSTQCASALLHIVGRPDSAAETPVMRHYVAPAHFRTLGIPLRRGRVLNDQDRAGRPRVVVINETAARRFWPGEDPIGRRVWFEGASGFGSVDESAEIVGVVGDAAYQPLDERPVQPDFFTSYAQFTYASRMVLVRTAGEPRLPVPAIGQAVRIADPDLALFDVQSMEERARMSWSKQSAQTALLMIIGGIALVLAAMGVYAVTSHFVTSRMRDLGVRIALGASSVQVARASMGRTMWIGVAGAAAGLLAAFAFSRTMRALLYETSPIDPLVFAGAATVMLVVVLAASSLPVRRALRIDPVEVLRTE
jgi:predicted permease